MNEEKIKATVSRDIESDEGWCVYAHRIKKGERIAVLHLPKIYLCFCIKHARGAGI